MEVQQTDFEMLKPRCRKDVIDMVVAVMMVVDRGIGLMTLTSDGICASRPKSEE